jgi:diguanylate cyclase (GGDEF)-like protein
MVQRARAAASLPVPPGWAAVQESIGRIAGLSLLTFDSRGRELAATGVPELCRLVGSDPEGARCCAASCVEQRELSLAENRKLFYRCHAGLQCFAVPVRVAGRAVAVVTGGRTLERAADVQAVGALARTLALPDDAVSRAIGALSMDNPRLLVRAAELAGRAAEALFTAEVDLSAERSRVALLTSLLAVGADFAREQAPHEVHALILDAAAILFDVGRACLLVHDELTGRFRLRTAFGAPAGLLPAAGLPADSPLLDLALRERAPAVIHDRARIVEGGLPPGTGSLAVFPLIAGDRPLGVLCVFDAPLGEEETAQLAAFCQSAALALSNALLREELSRRTRQLERTDRIRERLTPLLAWDEVIEAVFEEAVLLAGAREASLMLFDRTQRTLRVSRVRGTHTAVLKAVTVAAGDGIAGRVAREGRPLLVEDLSREAGLGQPRRMRYRTGSFLVVPLVVRGRVLGVINLADKDDDAPFCADDLDAVLAVTAHASWALQRSALHGRMRALREQAITDPLTGLANRRYLESRLREEASRAKRHGSSFTLTMIDLDNFKTYNDRGGHPAGDALLAAVARVIKATARDTDLVVRYGGDEFALVSPETRSEATLLFVERLRQAVEDHPFDLPGMAPAGELTLSAGVAEFPADAGDPAALVRAADTALYRAKAGGRNRIVRTGPGASATQA